MSKDRMYIPTNRFVCSVLDEMRKCHETHNYSILLSLIEEVQTMVNRMEAGLEDKRDLKKMAEHKSELKKEIRELEDRRMELRKDEKELKKLVKKEVKEALPDLPKLP